MNGSGLISALIEAEIVQLLACRNVELGNVEDEESAGNAKKKETVNVRHFIKLLSFKSLEEKYELFTPYLTQVRQIVCFYPSGNLQGGLDFQFAQYFLVLFCYLSQTTAPSVRGVALNLGWVPMNCLDDLVHHGGNIQSTQESSQESVTMDQVDPRGLFDSKESNNHQLTQESNANTSVSDVSVQIPPNMRLEDTQFRALPPVSRDQYAYSQLVVCNLGLQLDTLRQDHNNLQEQHNRLQRQHDQLLGLFREQTVMIVGWSILGELESL